jgi:iron(II)-dependent oxidoreductase
MRTTWRRLLYCLGVAAATIGVAIGIVTASTWLTGAGAVGLVYAAWRFALAKRSACRQVDPVAETMEPAEDDTQETLDPEDSGALVGQMLSQGRYALLLRPQIAGNLDPEQYRTCRETLEAKMALVPDGEVVLGRIDEALEDGRLEDEEITAAQARVVQVERFFLDRYPVTNDEFRRFVEAGGYQQTTLWDESILPALLHFVDSTGQPGPAFWKDGRCEPGRENHPVVGISWFEAAAYARWSGKRLPTNAEWVKAGCWPVKLDSTTRIQRRYPWGDSMDYTRANLWGSGRADTAPVDEFAEGVSVGGVFQLIGNVWEWTRSEFGPTELADGHLITEVPMKSIRGGAFDTYFENQATCQFQSGEAAVARKHNIGFRCAIGVCDITLSHRLRELEGILERTDSDEAIVEEVHV